MSLISRVGGPLGARGNSEYTIMSGRAFPRKASLAKKQKRALARLNSTLSEYENCELAGYLSLFQPKILIWHTRAKRNSAEFFDF